MSEHVRRAKRAGFDAQVAKPGDLWCGWCTRAAGFDRNVAKPVELAALERVLTELQARR
jgi:hypothetical protein